MFRRERKKKIAWRNKATTVILVVAMLCLSVYSEESSLTSSATVSPLDVDTSKKQDPQVFIGENFKGAIYMIGNSSGDSTHEVLIYLGESKAVHTAFLINRCASSGQ